MKTEHMIHMANGIAQFFSSYPREEAIAGVTDHLAKFWEKRMRQQIIAYVAETGGKGLHELALEAVKRLPPVPAAKATAPAS
ncbi:MAG TPA: formate dehydrogenase subunit delta [Stellaceae bacterium]|nr:formate dehydrogenase subunit delta [Stellaceae bacterium]